MNLRRYWRNVLSENSWYRQQRSARATLKKVKQSITTPFLTAKRWKSSSLMQCRRSTGSELKTPVLSQHLHSTKMFKRLYKDTLIIGIHAFLLPKTPLPPLLNSDFQSIIYLECKKLIGEVQAIDILYELPHVSPGQRHTF